MYPWSPVQPSEVSRYQLHLRITAAFAEELRSHGWIEGQNLFVERRYANGKIDRLPELAADLVALNVDVIYAPNGTAGLAVKRLTSTIPIVTMSGDMIRQGLVSNLARPEGNVTGQNVMFVELAGKRLHLLRELLPRASRIAVFGCGPGTDMGGSWPSTKVAAETLKISLLEYTPQTSSEIETALKEASRRGAEGLLLLDCPRFNAIGDKSVFLQHRLPAIYYAPTYTESGGLMAYGPDDTAIFRREAWYIGRILNGAKPSELPVEQPTKFRLLINLKTANVLGLTIPPSLLAQAEVIE